MAIQSVKISDVKSNPNNPRLIKDDKFTKLVQSLKDFPEMANVRPIVVNQDFVVLGGNMRLKAMKEAGWKEVPVQVVDWSEDQQKEFIVKDNVGFGEWDWDMLANEWDADDLEKWGLDVPQVFEEPEAEEDDFAVPDGGIETDIVLGDLFEIGEHRLLCGDSTDSDAVARLMGNNSIVTVVTDPPYGINWDGNYDRFTGKKGISPNEYSDIKNDNKSFDPSYWISFDEVILWGANIYCNKLPSGQWLVWDKRASDGSSFLADAEIAWQKSNGYGVYIKSINQQSEKSKTRDIAHPTKKPIDLMVWCLQRLKYTGAVLDPYSGSGSTMVAAHQLKRRCYGMELDPKYCQVIVDRMLKLDPNLVIKRNGEAYLKSDENQTQHGISA